MHGACIGSRTYRKLMAIRASVQCLLSLLLPWLFGPMGGDSLSDFLLAVRRPAAEKDAAEITFPTMRRPSGFDLGDDHEWVCDPPPNHRLPLAATLGGNMT